MITLMRLCNFLFDRINNALNYVVLFEQRPYLLKIQLSSGFQVRFVQISRKGKTIIHLLDKIKCPINSTHDLEILPPNKLGK